LIQHIACARGRKRFKRGGRRSFEPVGSVLPTEDEREWPNHRGLPPRPKGERSIAKARFEGTTQRTRRSCAPLQKTDTAKDAAGGPLQTLTTGSDFLLGNTWEQDQKQDAYLPAYRPLENKTERQTVSSARREQGPRALLTKRSPSREQGREINGLIDALGTRIPSAAHQMIESAAESEIGPTLDFTTVVPDSVAESLW
jgi:hypothetical protein